MKEPVRVFISQNLEEVFVDTIFMVRINTRLRYLSEGESITYSYDDDKFPQSVIDELKKRWKL
jgi:hypothetical protein